MEKETETRTETAFVPPVVAQTKQFRKDLDDILQRLKHMSSVACVCAEAQGPNPVNQRMFRSSQERSEAIKKIKEAIMWLGMDLKAMKEGGIEGCENPYPQSYNPESPVIEKTADGLSL